MRTAATARVVLLNSKGQMLIVRRSQTDLLQPGAWDIPGGQVEPNEDIKAAAIREAQEEVGITPTDPQLFFATSDMRGTTSKTWLFYGAEVPDEIPIVLSREHDQYQWVRPQEFKALTDYPILLRFCDYITANGVLEHAADK